MPTNLYGPGDNFESKNSHVIPGLIYRFHEAKIKNLPNVIIWGTGKAKREFLFIDDMVSASIRLMNVDKKIYEKYSKPRCSHINVGYGSDLTISELANSIKEIVNFNGKIKFDPTQPDGTPRKLLDSQILNNFGFKPEIGLKEGLRKTYEDYLKINEHN